VEAIASISESVHQFHHGGVDTVRRDLQLFPQCLPLLRGLLQCGIRLLGPGELLHEEIGQLTGDFQRVAPVSLDLKEGGDVAQAAGVFDLVRPALALGHELQRLHQHAPMIGVRGGAGGDLTQQITRNNGVGVGAADAFARFRGDAARAHMAQPATDARHAELALRLLTLKAIPHRGHAFSLRDFDHLIDGRVTRYPHYRGFFFGY
jgi:hypothetical protein